MDEINSLTEKMLPAAIEDPANWSVLSLKHGHHHKIDHGHIKWDDLPSIIYFTGEITVSLLCIFGNALVLEGIRRHRSLHTPTNVFIFNLAVSDLFVGLVVVPAQLSFYGGLISLTFTYCLLVSCLILVITYTAITMLLVIACERFIATRFPFSYSKHVDIDCARYIVVVVWLSSAVLGTVPMMGWNNGLKKYHDQFAGQCTFFSVFLPQFMVYFDSIFMFLVPLLIITCVYGYIALVVKKHQQDSINLHARFKIKFIRNSQATKLFAVVITAFFCLWLPITVVKCINFFTIWEFCDYHDHGGGSEIICHFPKSFLWLSLWLKDFHSLVNPIIYYRWNSTLRVAMRNVLFNQTRPVTKHSVALATPRNSFARKRKKMSTFLKAHSEEVAEILLGVEYDIIHRESRRTLDSVGSKPSTSFDKNEPIQPLGNRYSSLMRQTNV